jgi:hypothetical protein
MPVNIAARRGAKAQRRKAAVAQKRKDELAARTTGGLARLAQSWPIRHCLLTESLFSGGMGVLTLARGRTPYDMTMVSFLLDTNFLGVKDAFIASVSDREFAVQQDNLSLTSPMSPVDPAYARKLLHDLVAWARGNGAPPHRDYAKLEPMFGDVSAASSDVEFQFGDGGKAVLLSEFSAIESILDHVDAAAD